MSVLKTYSSPCSYLYCTVHKQGVDAVFDADALQKQLLKSFGKPGKSMAQLPSINCAKVTDGMHILCHPPVCSMRKSHSRVRAAMKSAGEFSNMLCDLKAGLTTTAWQR